MSTIGVEITKKQIRFASDSQTTIDGETARYDTEPKLFKVKNIIVGLAATTDMKQLFKRYLDNKLKYASVKKLRLKESADVHSLINDFFDVHKNTPNFENRNDLGLMVISDSEYTYRYDLRNSSCTPIYDHVFIGSGANYAKGAYLTFRRIDELHYSVGASFKDAFGDIDPLKESIKVACDVDLFSGGEIRIIETE